MGGFAVTAGHGTQKLAQHFEDENDDYNAILTKAIADRLAEAFAEMLHEKVRKEYWGYAPDENFSNEELIREKYTGIRPAAGYPAQPDHTEKDILFDLLDVPDNAGIRAHRIQSDDAGGIGQWPLFCPSKIHLLQRG